DGLLLVGVDADVTGNLQAPGDDVARRQLGVFQQGGGRGLGVGTARADGNQVVLRFDHVTVAGDDQRRVLVGHGEQGLKATQGAIGAPVFRQFNGGAHQLALVFFQLRFEALEQGEGVGGAAGETGNHLVVEQAADLAGVAFHDGVAKRYLAVAADDDTVATAYRYDGGHGVGLL